MKWNKSPGIPWSLSFLTLKVAQFAEFTKLYLPYPQIWPFFLILRCSFKQCRWVFFTWPTCIRCIQGSSFSTSVRLLLLRFWVQGTCTSFSSSECFVFNFGSFVFVFREVRFRVRVLRASVLVLECFVCDTTNFVSRPEAWFHFLLIKLLLWQLYSCIPFPSNYGPVQFGPVQSYIFLTPTSPQPSPPPISYPESSGSLVSGLVARRDSGEMEFFQFFWLVIRVTMRLVKRK